jgi:hypothetical protein
MLSLRHIYPDFDDGITRVKQLTRGGAQPPRGSHPGFVQINKGSIFSLTDTERVFEVRVHYLGQISG